MFRPHRRPTISPSQNVMEERNERVLSRYTYPPTTYSQYSAGWCCWPRRRYDDNHSRTALSYERTSERMGEWANGRATEIMGSNFDDGALPFRFRRDAMNDGRTAVRTGFERRQAESVGEVGVRYDYYSVRPSIPHSELIPGGQWFPTRKLKILDLLGIKIK